MNSPAATPLRGTPVLVAASYAVLYFVWGSSFVANKMMVMELPPLLGAGVRFVAAGVLLGLVARWRGARLPTTADEWRHVAVMGLLTVLVSNGINVLALQYVASNQSALLNATAAFWIALLGTVGAHGHPLSPRTRIGLAVGFAGVALVLWPRGGFSAANLGWQLAIIAGCVGWAGATLYHRLVRPKTAPLMFTALQMLVGGLVTGVLALLGGDAAEWHYSLRGHLALLYLIVFSSCLAYTAFAYLMPRTTPARLGTYAYVNPVVAAVVGWALLGETLSGLQLVGSAVIVVGVALVTLPQRATTPEEPTG